MKSSTIIYNTMQVGPRYRPNPFWQTVAAQGTKTLGKYVFQEAKRAYNAPRRQAPRRENKGGAAPIPTRPAGYRQRKAKKRRKAKKCRNMKGMALKKEVCKLSNQIKELKNSESASLGLMTYRVNGAGGALAPVNAQAVVRSSINRTNEYEAVLAKLKYYDPSAPATLITASAALGTYQKNFLIKSIYSKLELRNNYLTDAQITVYLCSVKADSSISCTNAWADGIATDAGNITASTELHQYPTDYDVFRDLWSTKRVASKVLAPGESTVCTHSLSDIEYNPALVDEHSATYQSRFKACEWLIVVNGAVSHDSASTEYGLSPCGVDYKVNNTWKVSYDAGVNLSYLEVDTNYNTPTNGFVQSHQPTPDNIGYSVS